MKIITVLCIARPGAETALVDLCRGMIAPSRAEQGCIHYSFYQDLGSPGRYFFYEEWTDQQAIDAHNASPHFLEFQPRFKELIAEPPVIAVRSVSA